MRWRRPGPLGPSEGSAKREVMVSSWQKQPTEYRTMTEKKNSTDQKDDGRRCDFLRLGSIQEF
jgi:hypothetical protein